MIKFFRKIRQQLLSQNRFSKYLIYAIGEIVLVVIGILIALSINSWNNNIQETKELHNFLENIKKNIQEDLVNIDEMKTRRISSIERSEKYTEFVHSEQDESTDYEEMVTISYQLFKDWTFKSNKSGFEALKNSGFLRKLSSTNLENIINRYYYVVEEILEQERSLNNTIESLQIHTYNDNILQELHKLEEMENKHLYFSEHKAEIRKIISHPSLLGANHRNIKTYNIVEFYSELEELGNDIVVEVNTIIKQ